MNRDRKLLNRSVCRTNAAVLSRFCCLILTVLTICGCSEKGKQSDLQKKEPGLAVPVVVAQAEAMDFPVELQNIGNVEAYATVVIRSQLTGQITKIHFREGQEVKAGDMLFTIDPRPLEGALRQAQADLKRDQANLASAKLEFERTKKLLESSIASRDDFDKSQAAFQALEATVMSDEAFVSRARLQLEFTSIRSPIDGRTGNLMVKQGNIVKAPDDSLVAINQVQPIYVTFSVPEQELPQIRQRIRESPLSVDVQAPGDPACRLRGELSFIDNAVDTATGRIKLKATFANTNDVLWPGQFVQAKLTLRTISQATIVPAQALQASQNGDFVFVVGSDSKVRKCPVTAGLRRGANLIVEGGVRPGETVVVDGQLRLVDGATVSVQPSGGGQSAAADARGNL